MKKSKEKNESLKTMLMLLKQITLEYYAQKYIDDIDIENEKSVNNLLKTIIENNDIDLGNTTIDYRETLIDYAEKSLSDDQANFGRLFYALYFEHTINSIINLYCIRNKIKKETAKKIIRSPIHNKFTWLLELLKFPPIKEEYFKIINDLFENRNAFVHYKWPIESIFEKDIEDIEYSNDKTIEEFNKIRKAVSYIKKYESRIRYNGNKKKIEDYFKRFSINIHENME